MRSPASGEPDPTGRDVAGRVIGITFLGSGLMLTDAMRSGLTGDVEQQYAELDLAIQPTANDLGPLAVVPPEVLELVRLTDGVEGAAGEIQATVTVLGRDGKAVSTRSQVGCGSRTSCSTRSIWSMVALPGRSGRGGARPRLADEADVSVGDTVQLETPWGATTATMVGISRFGSQDAVDDGGTISFDETTAVELLNAGVARLLGGPGANLDRGPAGGGRAPGVCCASVEPILRPRSSRTARRSPQHFVSVLRPVLQASPTCRMFVCAFVIFNTFSVVVTQRFRELALIRAVGGTPAQVRRSLMVEGLAIGVVSSAIGILGGIGLTVGVQAVLDRLELGLPNGSLRVTLRERSWSACWWARSSRCLSVLSPRSGRVVPSKTRRGMRETAVDTSGTSTVRAVLGVIFLGLAAVFLGPQPDLDPKWYFVGPGALLLFIRPVHRRAAARPCLRPGRDASAGPVGLTAVWRRTTRCATPAARRPPPTPW